MSLVSISYLRTEKDQRTFPRNIATDSDAKPANIGEKKENSYKHNEISSNYQQY